jgi:hypothetical protein
MCVGQSNKLAKLESERQEWQRRIIETEREKRVNSFSPEKVIAHHQKVFPIFINLTDYV